MAAKDSLQSRSNCKGPPGLPGAVTPAIGTRPPAALVSARQRSSTQGQLHAVQSSLAATEPRACLLVFRTRLTPSCPLSKSSCASKTTRRPLRRRSLKLPSAVSASHSLVSAPERGAINSPSATPIPRPNRNLPPPFSVFSMRISYPPPSEFAAVWFPNASPFQRRGQKRRNQRVTRIHGREPMRTPGLVQPLRFLHQFLNRVSVNRGAHVGSVAHNHVQRADQFLLGIRLQDIASGPGAKGAANQFRGGVQRQQQNLCIRQKVPDDPGGLQAIQARHGHVHDNDLGFQFLRKSNGFLAIVRLTTKLPLREGAQNSLHSAANEGVVIDN